MAYYGNNLYGSINYGPYTLVDFDVSPFNVLSSSYGAVTLTWTKPSGAWDLLHVVRNQYGFPTTADDGDLLLEIDSASSITSIVDNAGGLGLREGQKYYYSIFVRKTSNQEWFKAGSAAGISVKNYGTADTMYEYLPNIYKSSLADTLFEDSSAINTDLYGLLQVFAFEYDSLKTQAENVKSRYDVLNVDGTLIPAMLNQFGFIYEKELGLQQARKILTNVNAIYTKHGTGTGLKNFVTAYSGYNATLMPVKNLMLSVNDSSYAANLGFWEVDTNATISQISGAGESPAVTPYVESTAPTDFPNIQTGVMKAVATAAGAMGFYCGKSAPKTKGIPVTAALAYSFSIYSRAKTTARSVTVNIAWYDVNGALISTSTNGTTTNSTSAWTRISIANATAPTGARFAVPYVSVAGNGIGEIHYFDAGQLEQSSSVTSFVDARRVDILLNANRVNWIPNPGFSNALTYWSASGLSSLATNSAVYMGAQSAQATANGTAAAGIIAKSAANTRIAVTAGQQYSWSMYVKDVDTAVQYQANIQWYTAASGGTLLSTSAGTATTVTSSGWTRVSVTATAPAGAVAASPVCISSTTPASTKKVNFSAALFEQSATANPYFDGSTGYYQSTDLKWETGVTGDGRSFYYKNYYSVYNRLKVVVGDYVPFGTPWAIFVAQTP